MIEIKEKHYFAYGSNMNLNQMAFRCPDAEVVEPVRLEGYCLAFRMSGGGNGVARFFRKKEALWKVFSGGSQSGMNSAWIVMRASLICMEKKPSR